MTDPGVDVPPEQFVAGVLTVSYDTMRETVLALRQSAEPALAQTPVIIGGWMVNAMVCSFVGADYWATDAMYGVQLCKQIVRGGNP